ncbi:GNAT family protein [Pedobacter nyackensis]|uniref:GNAT family N-acetyltransferase n=1 Tax=Pedobacter nyackensis TaxID=475255 RepID=UPI002930296F|nr:GNAT family protein [Pedobacter nyackensis]
MNVLIYLRPLELADARVSYKWRNNPEIWKYTEFKPDRHISREIETKWLSSKLKKTNEKRFAICLLTNKQYIGNVQLIDIDHEKAWFHIFIGEKKYWGRGISQKATTIVLYYAFSELKLKKVLLEVNSLNIPAWKLYEKIGFTYTGKNEKSGFREMTITKAAFSSKNPSFGL